METDEMRWSRDKISSLGIPMSPQEISKRYKLQSLGMPPRHPFFIGKNQVTFQTLYFYRFIFYAFFLEHLYFCFQFSFVLFAAINGWTPTNFFWRWHTPFFIAKNTLVFILIVQRVFSFSSTALAFVFRLDFCSDLVISLHQGVFRPLVYVGFHQKSCFEKVWMLLEKRKKVHANSGTNGSLFRLWLRLLHVMLDVILIVCLVVFAVAWIVSNDWDCLMSLWKNHVLFLLYGSILLWFSPLMLYLGWLGASLQHVWL
jgi:hypothetical protein